MVRKEIIQCNELAQVRRLTRGLSIMSHPKDDNPGLCTIFMFDEICRLSRLLGRYARGELDVIYF